MSDMSDAQLHLLEQISNNLTALTGRIADMDRTQRQTLERLVRLEERSNQTEKIENRLNDLDHAFRERLNGHSTRLAELEAHQNQLKGAGSAADWLTKLWPIATALLAAVVLYITATTTK